MMTRMLFSLLLTGISCCSVANGWFESTLPDKTGNGLFDNKFRLTQEDLSINLLEEHAEVKVVYHFENHVQFPTKVVKYENPYTFPNDPKWTTSIAEHLESTFYFPIICDIQSEPGYLDFNAYKDCNVSISGTINGTPVKFTPINFGEDEYKTVKLAFLELTELTQERMPSEASFYKAIVPIKEGSNEFEINFIQNYKRILQGSSKDFLIEQSDLLFAYDFSPAANWDSNNQAKLNLAIHSTTPINTENSSKNLKTVSVGANSLHPFNLNGSTLIIEKKPSLQQYLSPYLRRGESVKITAEGESIKNYPANNAIDGDLTTAWCSKSARPTLTLTLNGQANWMMQPSALYITDGYVKSDKTRYGNSRPKLITISGSVDEINLPELSPQSLPVHLLNLSEAENEQSNDRDSKITIKILKSRKGLKFEETCVSEIIPLYRG